MIIREYKSSDNKEILNLYNECFMKDFDEIVMEPTGKIFVAVDEVIVGMVTLDIFNDIFKNVRYGYLNNVCVSKDYRGRGIAKLLMKRVEGYCNDNDLDYVMLTSNKKRVDAWNLYFDCGYQIKETCLFEKNMKKD